jgi:flavin reductase (DIM6/NTAB) family NADH-FMN oxidoreductase RutF
VFLGKSYNWKKLVKVWETYMGKSKVKFNCPPFMLPVSLVGSNVNGKPSFEAIAWFNLLEYEPSLIGLSSDKSHYTNIGIRENRTFSVNLPSSAMARATDFCGLYSGSKVDKSKMFDVFYGELKTAPMISECPVNVECRLSQTLELLHCEVFIGEVVGVYMEDKYLTDNKPDIGKIDPLLFEGTLGSYWKVGEKVGQAFKIGKACKPKQKKDY